AESRGPSAQRPHERQGRGNSVEKESEPPHVLKSLLGLTLDLIERVACSKKNGIETAGGYCGKYRVAVLYRHLEGTACRIDRIYEGPCPGEQRREDEIGPSSRVFPSAPFEQIAGHLSEPITFIIVAEARACDQAQSPVVVGCGATVAVLEAEIGCPANTECV